MNYIGIDLGTSAVKLLLMEGSGKILKIVSREYPICFPKPGWFDLSVGFGQFLSRSANPFLTDFTENEEYLRYGGGTSGRCG